MPGPFGAGIKLDRALSVSRGPARPRRASVASARCGPTYPVQNFQYNTNAMLFNSVWAWIETVWHGWRHLNSSLFRRTADADAKSGEAPSSTDIVKTDGKSGDEKMAAARSSVEQVKAVAAKISAARRLARKLAEEKAAVSALTDGNSMEAELYGFQSSAHCSVEFAAFSNSLPKSSGSHAESRGRLSSIQPRLRLLPHGLTL